MMTASLLRRSATRYEYVDDWGSNSCRKISTEQSLLACRRWRYNWRLRARSHSFGEFKQHHAGDHRNHENQRLRLSCAHRHQRGTRAEAGEPPTDAEKHAATDET